MRCDVSSGWGPGGEGRKEIDNSQPEENKKDFREEAETRRMGRGVGLGGGTVRNGQRGKQSRGVGRAAVPGAAGCALHGPWAGGAWELCLPEEGAPFLICTQVPHGLAFQANSTAERPEDRD